MKILIKMFFVLSIASFIGCNGNKGDNSAGTQDSTSTTMAIDNSQETDDNNINGNPDPNNTKDSTVFDNESFKVTVAPHEEEVGTVIGVNNKTTGKSFSVDKGASYFVGVIDSFLIVDDGTGTSRGLSVHNMNSSKEVFSVSYVGELDIKDKKVNFKSSVEIADAKKRPECSDELKEMGDGLGYVENQAIDLKIQKLIKTGKYECWYFE